MYETDYDKHITSEEYIYGFSTEKQEEDDFDRSDEYREYKEGRD